MNNMTLAYRNVNISGHFCGLCNMQAMWKFHLTLKKKNLFKPSIVSLCVYTHYDVMMLVF